MKGVEKQISKSDLRQCESWVTDYTNETQNAKGILIANQLRLTPYIREPRSTIEYNLKEYAKTRQICIIPSLVLFETVNS